MGEDAALAAQLAGWDGKSADDVRAIYQQAHDRAGFVDTLLAGLADSGQQKAASWLLKHHLAAGAVLAPGQVRKVYAQLAAAADWETRLHLLQSMPYMPVPAADRVSVEHFLRQMLPSPNKFVRAWAYNGFHELARQYPQYRAEVEAFFAMALRDESAAVKARIRQLVKKGFDG